MDPQDLIHRWTQRRREIIKSLPPDLLAEYKALGRLIKELMQEYADELDLEARRRIETSEKFRRKAQELERKSLELQNARELAKRGLKASRVPLSRRKDDLIAFLETHEPATRQEIIDATAIPLGSLSELLKGKEFEQASRGFWRLRRPRKNK